MTTTTYLEIEDQATGANDNTWGDVADSNFTILEQAIARFTSISTTGGTTTLTTSQNRYPIIRITGALSSAATIVVRTAEKNWTFINATTGTDSLTVKTLAGTGKTIPRGRAVTVYCDGTNVERVRHIGIAAAQAGGTVNAITATFEPATTTTELQDGTMFLVEAAGANTSTTPTFSPDSLTARTITKYGGQALGAGDIFGAGHKLLLCYDASSTRYELLNPVDVLMRIGDGTDLTPASGWGGTHLKIAGNGYSGGMSLDGSAMWIGHNSFSRDIYLATGLTAQVIIDGNSGKVGIGNKDAAINLYVNKTITGGATAYGTSTVGTIQSDVTSVAASYNSFVGTAAAAFTLPNLFHYIANQNTFGASSIVTTQNGFTAASTLIGATSNRAFVAQDTAAVTASKTAYGFYSAINIATGGGDTWAFYGAGTAWSLFSGPMAYTEPQWLNTPAHTSKSAAATLTGAELKTQIISCTGTGPYNITLPTATNIDAAFSGIPATTSIGFDFFIINGATNTVTVVAGTGTSTGGASALTVAAGASAHFRLRRSGAATYIIYRLA